MAVAKDNRSPRCQALTDSAMMVLIVGERVYEVALCIHDELMLFETPEDHTPCDAELLMLWGSRQIKMLLHLVEGMSSASHVVRIAQRAHAYAYPSTHELAWDGEWKSLVRFCGSGAQAPRADR